MNWMSVEAWLDSTIRREFLPREPHALDPALDLRDTGILDSMGFILLSWYIEEEFGINVPDEDLVPKHFASISLIANYIRSKIRTSDGHH